jgi:hypothetical protein
MPKLARVKAAARNVLQRTNSDLLGGCIPIIHLEDAVIVLEKVAGDRAGKGMLHIRIDVDLHCVVVQIFKFSLQAKINEYFGGFLLYRQQVMACGTIVGNCLTVRADVRPVVAAEAARRIIVTKIVRMSTPTYAHVRKNVVEINPGHVVGRLLD